MVSDACCDLSVTEWTTWQPWGRCSETDGNKQGTRDRIRYCVNPTPKSVTKGCQYSSFDIDRMICLGTNSTIQGCIGTYCLGTINTVQGCISMYCNL